MFSWVHPKPHLFFFSLQSTLPLDLTQRYLFSHQVCLRVAFSPPSSSPHLLLLLFLSNFRLYLWSNCKKMLLNYFKLLQNHKGTKNKFLTNFGLPVSSLNSSNITPSLENTDLYHKIWNRSGEIGAATQNIQCKINQK